MSRRLLVVGTTLTLLVAACGDNADNADTASGSFDTAGWGAMITVVSILMIAVGVLLPFIPIIALAVWLGRRYMATQRERAAERAAYVEAHVAAQNAAQAQAQPTQNPGPG
jgi:flagellar biosynthesis component FlhA